MKTNPDAFDHAGSVTKAIIKRINGINKSRKDFMLHILMLWLGIRGRYNFTNMARYGKYGEQTYRNHFSEGYDFTAFNSRLIDKSCSPHRILAFDPSYLPKSGKQTDNLGMFWSGCASRVLRGLEIGGLAVVDIKNNTAMILQVTQTPDPKKLKARGESLLIHYAGCIIKVKQAAERQARYLAVDGYFANSTFIDRIMDQTNLHIISKLRCDANLQYLYEGPQQPGPGRPKVYGGKVDVGEIDTGKITFCGKDGDVLVYNGVVYSPSLKRKVKIACLRLTRNGKPVEKPVFLFSTDLDLDGMLIYQYYKARYQIEFLFRDGKQHTGLTHCQARSAEKLHFHFNASLTAVSLAKAAHYLNLPKDRKKAFSMADIKTLYLNKLMAERIFCNSAFDLSDEKIKTAYRQALLYGRMAA